MLLQDNYEHAETIIDQMLGIFGEDRFYVEAQPNDNQVEQKIVNNHLFTLSQKKGIPAFCSADCHYFRAEDRYAHEVMLAIQTQAKMDDTKRMTFGDCRVHMRTQAEMLDVFKGHEDVLWRTGEIADRCNFEFETGKLYFPQFEIPTNDTIQETEPDHFARLCKEGLTKLFEHKRIITETPDLYWSRLQLEIDLIIKMGFVTYFLVVSDFIMWAKRNNIPVGPGRGSAAGSLVAWALEITDIDPLRYNLLFERFLNPERITMPDIDIDFCIEGRERVIQYVKDKYGHDRVCQIITFGTMMAKGVVKDVARALGLPFEDANSITDLIPDQLKITLAEALEQEPKLQELKNSNPKVQQIFEVAFKLEGLTRHASKHAAGVVIAPQAINEILPVYIPPKTNELVTQYAMTELESLGFLKMDFLGLKNLTLIQRVIDLITKNHGITLDPNHLPLDDTKTFALLSAGNTSGVFQLESSGLKEVLRKLQPTCFEDIIAVNALYRPGPLGSGMVDDFIERRHGRQAIQYLFPELEPILKETYGVIVYQEQVMKIASAIGHYSLGEADILRRAMGKKKAEEMEKQRAIFTSRAQQHGFDGKKAGELFDLMAYFAGYGFNKSHSAAYGMIAYQTAYLKAQYPLEFMACLISLEARDPEKMAFYIQEARDMHIEVLAPDIHHSDHEFTTKNNVIHFGLQGIKNVGDVAIESIIAERTKAGPFKDLLDFCIRVDLRACNKRVLENLIAAGAFDCLSGNRAQKTEELAIIMDRALEKKEAHLTGQLDLFSATKKENSATPDLYPFTQLDEWDLATKLEKEKQVLGLYVSAQPLDGYKKQIEWLKLKNFKDMQGLGEFVVGYGVLKSMREITTKKGDKMAFVQLEDTNSKAELILFPKVYQRVSELLKHHSVFIIKGILDEGSEQVRKIKANDLIVFDKLFDGSESVQRISLTLPEHSAEKLVPVIKEKIIPGKTSLEIIFTENNKQLSLLVKHKISCMLEMLMHMHENNIKVTVIL